MPTFIKFFSGGLTATTAATPSIVTGDSGGNDDEDNEGEDQAAPLGVLEHESHGPARPTLTRVVPRTARANKGLSHNSYADDDGDGQGSGIWRC